jgi:hypothetical protein
MSKDEHPEPDPRRPAVSTPEMTNDNHPEPEQRSLSQQLQTAWARVQESADTFQRVAAGLPERLPRPDRFSRRLQVVWAHAIEGAGTIRRSVADELQEWLPRRRLRKWPPRRSAVAMPSMPDLAWRDWVLFGFTGASILVALITAAIVIADMLTRGTPWIG